MKNLIKSVAAQILDAITSRVCMCGGSKMYSHTCQSIFASGGGKRFTVLTQSKTRRKKTLKRNQACLMCSISVFWAKKVGVKSHKIRWRDEIVPGNL